MNMASTDESKVVYVLGAGFSIPAGAPTQAQILGDIFRLDTENQRIQKAGSKLRRFLEEDLRISPEAIAQVALEDVYTPIDRCIADGTALKSRGPAELETIREDLGYLISIAISRRITRSGPPANNYIRDFAQYIVAKAAKRAELAANASNSFQAKEFDPLSIISLNWDAGVELMEALRLVFIGYSLPHADFEFRHLLSRMVHRDATIDVVLFEGPSDDEKRRYKAEKDRYRQFFGSRKLRFHSTGVIDFVNAHIAPTPTPSSTASRESGSI
jgi:hypothetical protein